ncbi:MAG: hypothetical protein Kapaf2KO_16070 [Candidatus Kapaibacteriales bacterium]
MKIWSAQIGYPGHPDYLDFHKKKEGGYLRYWRVTELELDMQHKDFYRPEWVEDKLDEQARQMASILENAADNFHHHTHRRAVITLPFDTELFGHWWFEGISFLERLIRNINNSNIISMKKGNDAINSNYPSEVVRLPEGSWGENSNHSVWMNEKNKWVWEEIYNSEKKLLDIYSQNDLDSLGATEKRLLNSALKQLILLQASDWGFLIHNSSSQDYAEHRFHSHLSDFNMLIDFFFTSQKSKLGKSEIAELEKIEERDSLFNELDTNMWKTL